MKKPLILGLVAAAVLSGCSSHRYEQVASAKSDLVLNTNLLKEINYPDVKKRVFAVKEGASLLSVSNVLAHKLGVDYVEWSAQVNPYRYQYKTDRLITLDHRNPQMSFLEAFEGIGLLPYYDEARQRVTVHPYSANQALVNQPHVFTPRFEEIKGQVAAAEHSKKVREQKLNDWAKYDYYKGYTVKETVEAWAKHSGYNSVVWFLEGPQHYNFLHQILPSNNFHIGLDGEAIIQSFLESELERFGQSIMVNAFYEKETGRLVVHPFEADAEVETFDVHATSAKANLERLGPKIGYDVEFLAQDYVVGTPYITVVSDYHEQTVESIMSGFPLNFELVEASKVIRVRDK
ncbi:lipoprotein [Vibrio barjaei]|uniref:lipoprotein n=1 Tax=Vibrio barjaei TaxID=1676683 RepID=UPI0022838DD0|nr:lipoprotein [Vibrio barjaei]MCY9872988.1 lipoprotein [Vibrio barjaei]